ncbi:protein plastid movement impaired 2 [Nicotiana attenuata]|uniref:Protein plastid movement impaired 2 n=1 Tax=Nicotiana attenuata TaxID=49451 RepID=A0A1J6JCK0_NICAT|nr:protein plastid movement impaired 2 [Nicotiana attenuata]
MLEALSCCHSVEELNEELVLVELARIEAIKEFRAIEAQRREDGEKHSAAMEENRKKMNDMVQEIQRSEELREKLALTTSDVQVLESELKQVKEMDRWIHKSESLMIQSDFLEKDLSLLQSLKEDLETAKQELASIKRGSFEFMASMDIVRNELRRISEESARLKKKGNKADLTIQNLNTKLLRAKAKLEAASDNEGKASSIASSLSLTLEQLRNEAEKERVTATEEAATSRNKGSTTSTPSSSCPLCTGWDIAATVSAAPVSIKFTLAASNPSVRALVLSRAADALTSVPTSIASPSLVDAWRTTLLRVKETLKAKELEEDDLT